VSAANQLRNKTPTSSQTTTPYQSFTGEIPNLISNQPDHQKKEKKKQENLKKKFKQ